MAPTYLIDYPVADNERSAATLRPLLEAGECTIGAQLHPWVNPPLDEEMSPANSFVGNLARDIERAKLAMLTTRIRQSFGATPIVYRAGRYGLGPNSAALLEEAGYRLDVSVRALFDYRGEGGPDFSRHPIRPWWAGPSGGVLELPLTAAYTGGLRRIGGALFPAAGRVPFARGILSRSRLLSRVALTPEGMPLDDALDAIRLLLDEGVGLFSLSFHSPSIEPGHTPYVRDATDLRRFWAWWDGVLALFEKRNVAPARPADLLDAAWRTPGQSLRVNGWRSAS